MTIRLDRITLIVLFVMIMTLVTGMAVSSPQENPELNDYQESQEGEQIAETVADKPYEIVVTPTLSRRGLRALIADVEEDFYEKFNELNLEKAYDIVCYRHTPTGSHIWRRVCEPVFMLRSRGNMASMVTFLLGSGSVGAQQSAFDHFKSEEVLLREKREEYKILQELMEEFTRSNSEFRQIGNVLNELKERLDNYQR